jgi:hypothetical protein
MILTSSQKQALLADRLSEFTRLKSSFGAQKNEEYNKLIEQAIESVKNDTDNTTLLYETINRLDALIGNLDPKESHFYIIFASQLIIDLIDNFLSLTDHPELISTLVRYIALLANKTGDVNELQNLYVHAHDLVKTLQNMDLSDSLISHLGETLRTLYFNYGIIATRTHKLNNLRTAYDFLKNEQPELATQFFAEAIKQIQIVDYPENVKDIIKEYYKETLRSSA